MRKIDHLKSHLKNGYNLLPVVLTNDGKVIPAFKGWQEKKCIDENNLPQYESTNGWGIVTGKLSGNLEVIDFDEKHKKGIFQLWKEKLPKEALELLRKLPITKTKNNGYHVHFRCKGIEGNLKLANTEDGETTIETRGEGGFVFEPPTPGYEYFRFDFSKTPTITAEERSIFFDVARSLDQSKRTPVIEPVLVKNKESGRPGDDYELKTTWEDLLLPIGWKRVGQKGEESYWQRAGKKDRSISATENYKNNGKFHVFSSSAGINIDHPGDKPGKSFSKFQLYAHLYHNDDYKAAAKELATKGFGEKMERNNQKVVTSETPTDELVFLKSSEIISKPIDWLWQGKIAKGKVTLVAGDPGLGKSQVSLFLAGIVSTGGTFPGGQKCKEGSVLLFSAEDDPEDTINPRLTAVGANQNKVGIFSIVKRAEKEKYFDLSKDIDLLEKTLEKEKDVSLIVIDPITAFLGDTDSHVNAEVRALLSVLSKLAAKHHVAIIVVTHLNKSTGGSALNKITGSLAFVAAARAAFMVIKDENDELRRLFLTVKNNIAEDKGGFAFKVEGVKLPGREFGEEILTSKVVWEKEPVTMSVNEAMRNGKEEGGVDRETVQWLEGFLRKHPDGVSFDIIEREAARNGISKRTLYRAEKDVFVEKMFAGKNKPKIWKIVWDEGNNSKEEVTDYDVKKF